MRPPPCARRLSAENPSAGGAVEWVLTEVVGSIRSETRKVSPDYVAARSRIEALHTTGKLTEAEVHGYARDRKFEETAIALSLMCGMEIDVVERALLDPGHDIALILARLAGFSSTTAKAILLLKQAGRGMSAQDLDQALTSYSRLQVETARRVLSFYRARFRATAAAGQFDYQRSPRQALLLRLFQVALLRPLHAARGLGAH